MATDVVKDIDYESMTYDQLLEQVGKAYEARDMKLMGQLSRLATKAEQAVEKAKRDALQAELANTTIAVSKRLNAVVTEMVDEGLLDGADGVWFARDFGETEEKGLSCRITKTARKTAVGESTSSGKSSYVANPAKSADLLAQVGSHIIFAEDTERTIDKQPHTMPAGMTFKEAYEYSTNGGWRNSIRMALLKEAGII